MTISVVDLTQWVGQFLWPFFRIAAVLMVAPLFGAAMVPARSRIALALLLTAAILPAIPPQPSVEILSVQSLLIIFQQIAIGIALGIVVQMVFDAMVIGGQTIAMGMGLGFATLVDPQRGSSVPVLGQYFLIMATLMFLAMDGHLALLTLVAESFHLLPISATGFGSNSVGHLLSWGTHMFQGAIMVALPAVSALIIVNMAFGVMSRAAPTLNLFAVGFPVAISFGFVILVFSAASLPGNLQSLLDASYRTILNMLGAG